MKLSDYKKRVKSFWKKEKKHKKEIEILIKSHNDKMDLIQKIESILLFAIVIALLAGIVCTIMV